MRVECNRVEFTIRAVERKNTSNGVVGGISLNHNRGVWNPMGVRIGAEVKAET